MIKASAGGGGKGMRVAKNDKEVTFHPLIKSIFNFSKST